MAPARRPVVIVGLGNPLRMDDGIGSRVVAELEARGQVPETVETLDLGTAGFAVLHAIAGRRKAVFIDCAFMGKPPGSITRFKPDEVHSDKLQSRCSLHEGDLLHTLELARKLGACPEDVVILGVEPERIESGQTLSPTLESRLDHYVQATRSEFLLAR